MSGADELAIRKARAEADAFQARLDAIAAAEQELLRSFPVKAREVVAILARTGFEGEDVNLLRVRRLRRRRTLLRDARYTYEERAGWLLHNFEAGPYESWLYYWLVSDGTLALSHGLSGTVTEVSPVDMRVEFRDLSRQYAVRQAYTALLALGERHARPGST